ncbi:MAG: hypothetical protein AB7E28_02030 [Desulfurella sp.]|jgi:hypothetical protein
MFKKTVLSICCCLLGFSQASNCFADSIIIKYQSGKTQVINLDESAKSIYSIQIQTKPLSETNVNEVNQPPAQITEQSKNSKPPSQPTKAKSSSKVIDVGNGIKIRWVTPNPYGGDY